MTLRIMVSRHSAFYSPLISTIAAGFLERHGLAAEYGILAKGQRSSALIREGAVDIMQSAVSSSWKPMEEGESTLPVHFAQINQRDGFFLVGREPDGEFNWKKLEGQSLLADHALQPLAMLKYAARINGVVWQRIHVVDAGAPEAMALAFRGGAGHYVHLQAPASHQLEADRAGHLVASVGEAMPPVAFSSLCCSGDFLQTEICRAFLHAFRDAKDWVQSAPPEEIARKEAPFFAGISMEALMAGIRRYQVLGCWDGGTAIPRELYEQALNVFESAGAARARHRYESVCTADAG